LNVLQINRFSAIIRFFSQVSFGLFAYLPAFFFSETLIFLPFYLSFYTTSLSDLPRSQEFLKMKI